MENLEIRYLEVRANTEDPSNRDINGTAIVFNSPSEDLGGFIEEIKPEACTPEFLASQDIVLLYNHETDAGVLARSKNGQGTLKYDVDAAGVNFNFTARDTSLGNEVLSAVKAGDLTQCSFAFRVAEGGEHWENIGGGMYKRTITKFECIRDFSLVLFPAYNATTASTSLRGLDELKADEQRKIEELQAQEQLEVLANTEAEEQRKVEELNNYYCKYENILAKYSN